VPIHHISDTARWVAHYRAMETERPDAIFHDPFAARLAGIEGKDIVSELPQGRKMAWALIVRTALFDEIIMDVISREKVDLVVNLAAGLDARPWRLPLSATLRWIDVDLPGILEHKSAILAGETPRCRYEAISTDLTSQAERESLVDRLGSSAERVLVITEGLLLYLTPEQVAELARELAKPASFRWWVIDLMSPRLKQMIEKRWGSALAKGNAPFRFAPVEGTAFFEPLGWKERLFRSTGEEGHRLKREMPLGWLWRILGRLASKEKQEEFRRMSGTVLLGRTAAP
jgi:methyltransferase (TIGR00027 family)